MVCNGWELCVLSFQFFCLSVTILKNQVYFKRKKKGHGKTETTQHKLYVVLHLIVLALF